MMNNHTDTFRRVTIFPLGAVEQSCAFLLLWFLWFSLQYLRKRKRMNNHTKTFRHMIFPVGAVEQSCAFLRFLWF